MWKSKHMKFLTTTEFDRKSILVEFENFDNTKLDVGDKEIFEKLKIKFKQKDYSIISEQEIQFLQKNPKESWIGYLIHRWKFSYYENYKEFPDFPLYLILEPISICNLKCPFCHQVDEKFLKNKSQLGMMGFELFKKIIDESQSGGTKAITLTCRGEPTMNPEIGRMLEYCKNKFIEFKMNTNATMLNEKLIHQILDSNLTDIVFSVDSYYKEEFESLRVGANFEKVLENIKKFVEIKEKNYPDSRIVTRISGVKMLDEQDPEKFKEFWENIVDFVVMVNALPKWDLYSNSKEEMSKSPCHYLGRSLSIYFDGSVIPCDMDYQGVLNMGNVKDNTIKEIWQGTKYKELFNSHKNNERGKHFPCDRCPA